jgi:GMP synthase (glutamine-hydrolysing)
MSIVVFQHHPEEGPGRLGEILANQGHHLRYVRLDLGQALPADLDNVDGVISMGGPQNVDEGEKYPWIAKEIAYLKQAHDAGLPVVGICLGAQMIAVAHGGKVGPMMTPVPPVKPGETPPADAPQPKPNPEVGWQNVKIVFPGTMETIYQGIPWDTMQFHLHGQEVTGLPPGVMSFCGSKSCRTQAFKIGFKTYAFQYHFEWNQAELTKRAKDPFVTQAGGNPEAIIADIPKYYDDYRRVGDRLCENIATLLMPVDKRANR